MSVPQRDRVSQAPVGDGGHPSSATRPAAHKSRLIGEPPDLLNNREDAVLIWIVLILAFSIAKGPKEIGSSFLALLRAAVQPKLLSLFVRRGTTPARPLLLE
jgi:hypothetical protein